MTEAPIQELTTMTPPSTKQTNAPVIVPIDTPSLGDRSYLAHDGHVAIVIDPQRDIDRVLALAEAAGVRIGHVFETHIHHDYVTGGLALATATGAVYHVNADDAVSYQRRPIRDGDTVQVSPSMRVCAIATPGHTYTHQLVHHQFASARRLADELPEAADVLPTHGFGSFCSAGSTGETTASTIGARKQSTPPSR